MANKKKTAEEPQEHTPMVADSIPDSLPIDEAREPKVRRKFQLRSLMAGILAVAILVVLGLVGFVQLYSGKIVPGVSAAGVYLGGMSKEAAAKAVQAKVDAFSGQQLGLTYNDKTVYIPVSGLDYKYDTAQTVEAAYQYGRGGNYLQQTRARLRALLSRTTHVAVYKFNVEKLTPVLLGVAEEVDRPVSDASLKFSNGNVGVNPSVTGRRLDLGFATIEIKDKLARATSATVALPVYSLEPTIDQAALAAAKHQADTFLSAPVSLTARSKSYEISVARIAGWIKATSARAHYFGGLSIESFAPSGPSVNLELDQTAIAEYIAGIAAKTDQAGQDAALAIEDGRAVVFRPSRDGIALDQADALKQISAALNFPGEREVVLKVKVTKPTITEGGLNDLGITELISEGETFFPGSPTNRMINIRTGAAKYNGVLLKPGETFSFGKLLGNVGPAEGFVPELVIIGHHEEYQYGGGLCQVASTAYRAALLGGLPIKERHNHSFAVRYYTAPYGAPGVDATIFYPQADFKFLNDTGHYILIQTILSGTTLKFQYYGTKTHSGQIRGPYFVYGSTDATKSSHTYFFRDILDLDGKVIKTERVDSYYSPSGDFPITKQFN